MTAAGRTAPLLSRAWISRGPSRCVQPPACKLVNTARTALELRSAGDRDLPNLGELEGEALSLLCWALFAPEARRTDLTFATGAIGAYRTACPATEAIAETDMIQFSRSSSLER
jgi:hypothetical protein